MKKTVTILFFIFLYHSGFSQVWKNLTSVNWQFNRCGAFAIDDTGYVFGGGYQTEVQAYDTASHNWTQMSNYPNNNTDGIVGCSLNGIGYAGTGTESFNFSTSFYKYNPGVGGGTWTQLANFPGSPRGYDVAFALDGKAYIGGGLTNYIGGNTGTINYQNGYSVTPYNDFFVYDPSTGTWDSIVPCPALGVSCDAVAFVIGDKAYVGTGGSVTIVDNGASIPQRDFWEYDTTSKVWTQIASLPGRPRAEASAFATCDKGYVGLGYINVSRDSDAVDFWQYNPSNNTWTQIANFGGGARNGAPAFTIGKTGYVEGGSNPAGGDFEDLWSYAAVVTPTFSADTSVCLGGFITFKDTSNYSPTNWYWQFPGGKPDTSSADSVTVEYDTAGTYNVILSAWNSCDSGTFIDSNYITVKPGGTLTVAPLSPSIPCSQSVALNVTNAGTNFKWTPVAGLKDTTGDTVVADPTLTTVYSVTGVDSTGCFSTGTDTVIVTAAPPLTILPQPGPLFCSGLSAELKAEGGGSNFIWTPTTGLSDTTSGDSVLASPLVTTTYTVAGNDSAGCATSGLEIVTVIASPNKPTFYQHGDTLTSSATTDNQWYMNGFPLNGDTSQNLVINNTSTDSFYVVVENEANGCSTSSDTTATTGINQVSLISNQLSIYPNPFNNDIFINISSSAQDVKDWTLQIIDVLGRTVYSRQSLNYNNDIDLSGLSSGVYFITVINKTGKAVVPVVKQN